MNKLITIATMFYNFALGVSCWHTVGVNVTLLPRLLRPNWFVRIALTAAGCYFFMLGVLAVMKEMGLLDKPAA